MRKRVLSLLVAAVLLPGLALAQAPAPVGGQTKGPERVRYVAPVYPDEAKSARVTGVVILELTVSPEGDVTDTHLLRSIALLDKAAIDAVKQWKYAPTMLNGKAVPVIITVTVAFHLEPSSTDSAAPESRTFIPSTFQPMAGSPQSPPPPEPVFLNGREALRVGGNIKAPERTRYVTPHYPQAALDGRIMGIVIIEAVIDESGHVATAKVLRSVPELDQAAIDAVLQWEYTPTLLNGSPVPLVMTVTVNFTMQ
jgi:TonB family protein